MNEEIKSSKMRILDLKRINETLGYVFLVFNSVLAAVGVCGWSVKIVLRGLSSGLNWCGGHHQEQRTPADKGCVMAAQSWGGDQKIFNHCSQETCEASETIQLPSSTYCVGLTRHLQR